MKYTKEEKQRIMEVTGFSEEEYETATTMTFGGKEIEKDSDKSRGTKQ